MSGVIDWTTPKRIRHLDTISARGIDVPPNTGCCFTVHALSVVDKEVSSCCTSDDDLLLLYRSEVVYNTYNPEWRPIDFEPTEALSSKALSSSKLVITLHAVGVDSSNNTTLLSTPLHPQINNDNNPTQTTQQQSVVEQDNEEPSTLSVVAEQQHTTLLTQQQQQLAALSINNSLNLPSTTASSIICHRVIDLDTIQVIQVDLSALGPVIHCNTIVLEFKDGSVWVDPPLQVDISQPILPTITTMKPGGTVATHHHSRSTSSPMASPRKKPLLGPQVNVATDNNNQQPDAATTSDVPPTQTNSVEAPSRRRFQFMSRLLGVGTLEDNSSPSVNSTGDLATEEDETEKQGGLIGGNSLNNNNNTTLETARSINIHTLRGHIATISTLRQQLEDTQQALQAIKSKAVSLQHQHSIDTKKDQEILFVQVSAQEYSRKAHVLASRVAAVKKEIEERTRVATVRGQALTTTLKVLQGSEKRLSDANTALHGVNGTGHLRQLLTTLTAHRCHLIFQLGKAYRLGPIPVSVPQAPPGGYLEERIDVGWAGVVTEQQKRKNVPSMGAGTWKGATSSSLYRQEMRLAVGGLELHPSVWRKAIESDGYDWDPKEDQEAGIALGHLAHIVQCIARYLEIPLRYPIKYRGSTSSIFDGQLPVGSWTVEPLLAVNNATSTHSLLPPTSSSTGWFGFGTTTNNSDSTIKDNTSNTSSPPLQQGRPPPPVEYPLHRPNNRERARFAVGVFLLNKDVCQLLQVHGIAASGPNQLLQNVYKLITAAESAFNIGGG